MNPTTSRRLGFEALEDRLTPATAFALDATGLNLLRFDTSAPAVVLGTTPITGLAGGATESLFGIDFRPATGQLYALGVNETPVGDDEGRLYTIDTGTGVATLVGPGPFSTTLADAATGYGFDFNPTVDLIRVVNDADQNLRVNPTTGALAGTDTDLAFAAGDPDLTGSPDVVGSAYTNNFAGAGTTSLFAIDSTLNRLLTQNPANDGTLIDVGPLGFDTTSAVGFDIAADGTAFAALTTGALASQLVTVNLTTGAATPVGAIGGLTLPVRGLAVAQTGSAAFSAATFSGIEGGTATVTLTRTGGTDGTATVQVSATGGTATPGTDFTGLPVTVTFNPGETTKTVTVTLPDDAIAEATETVTLALSSPTGGITLGGQSTATLSITDNEPPDAAAPTVTINQSAGQADPTNNATVLFTTVFSEPVTGFDASDVVLSGTGSEGATVVVSGSGTTYTVAVSGFTRAGPVIADVRPGAATDTTGNASLASTSTDNRVVVASGVGIGLDRNVASAFAVGADVGGPSIVRVFNPDGTERFRFDAFPGFTGGVRVAVADFNADGVEDVAVGTGPGVATLVRVIDGATKAELFSVAPFEASFTGGVYVAAGDVTGDDRADLVITPDQGGGPRVRIFSGDGFGQVIDFFGIEDPAFRGGARSAVGDVDLDGFGDLAVAAGFGGGPRIAVFDGSSLSTDTTPVKFFGDFFVFENTLRNGVFIALGDLSGDGFADVIAGGGPGGGPRVFALSGAGLLAGTQVQVANFFAGDTENRGGIRLATKDLDGDNRADLVTGSGTDAGSRVTAYAGSTIPANGTPPELFAFDAFADFDEDGDGDDDGDFDGGVYVG